MKTRTLLAGLLLAFGLGTSAQAGYVDLFNDPFVNNINTVTSTGGIVFQEYPGDVIPSTSILGGYRDLIVNVVYSNGMGTPTATAEVGGGGFSLSTSSGDIGIASIQWDGKDGSATLNPVGLGGLNLINQTGCPISGCDRFQAEVLVADLGFEYQIGVYTDADNYSLLSANTLYAVASSELADFEFDWFQLATGSYTIAGLPFSIVHVGTVDFTNIGAIEFIMNSDGKTVAVDLALGYIVKTVPEPGSLALLGIGFLGAALTGRRMRGKKA